MMPRFLFVLMILLPVTACAQQSVPGSPGTNVISPPIKMMPANASPNPQADGTCVKPMDMIGQSHEVFQRIKLKYTVRVLWPDTPATMDYSPMRTNFILDKNGIIREIHCG